MRRNILLLLVCSLIFISACQKDKLADLGEGIYATIETERGDITLQLFGKEVPLTVSNFIALAEGNHPNVADSLKGKKFYDGLKFHRVIENTIIQGGDILGNGTGNPGYTFGDEFPKDAVGTLLFKHDTNGVLSMANSGPATNGSQFFITHKSTPWLNGMHTIFGRVIYGQNVADSIAENDVIKYIKIIRKGEFATNFDAPKVFENEMNLYAEKQKNRSAKLQVKKTLFLDSLGINKARKTDSGLRILTLKKGKGVKVHPSKEITTSLILHTGTGKLISKSPAENPFIFTINNQPMIAGFKEGILTMREGDKKILFIPYYIGYGEPANGLIPEKSDLVFEIEILKVEN
jgi:peptidyl-prolyl cis-trans isomerase A (cyclophilin A)